MKNIYIILFLLIVNFAYSQFDTPSEFLDFSLYTSSRKEYVLQNNSWEKFKRDTYMKIIKKDTLMLFIDATNHLEEDKKLYKDYTILRFSNYKRYNVYVNELKKKFNYLNHNSNTYKFVNKVNKDIFLRLEEDNNKDIYVIEISYIIKNFYRYLVRANKEVEAYEKEIGINKSMSPSSVFEMKNKSKEIKDDYNDSKINNTSKHIQNKEEQVMNGVGVFKKNTFIKGEISKGYFSATGRELLFAPNIENTCSETGIIMVKINIDNKGKVINPEYGIKGSTTLNKCLLDSAKEVTLKTKWIELEGSNSNIQEGYLRITFK